MTDHTKGRLADFVGNANGRGLVRIEAAHDSPDAGEHVASLTRGKKSEANARRLVACWNACEGIPTEVLENSVPIQESLTYGLRATFDLIELLAAMREVRPTVAHSAKIEAGQSKEILARPNVDRLARIDALLAKHTPKAPG